MGRLSVSLPNVIKFYNSISKEPIKAFFPGKNEYHQGHPGHLCTDKNTKGRCYNTIINDNLMLPPLDILEIMSFLTLSFDRKITKKSLQDMIKHSSDTAISEIIHNPENHGIAISLLTPGHYPGFVKKILKYKEEFEKMEI